ncbi:MAG: DNA gyrase subunit A [Alistipes sp.]|nr:DNA gyrase subunit A [Alistipes sp.]
MAEEKEGGLEGLLPEEKGGSIEGSLPKEKGGGLEGSLPEEKGGGIEDALRKENGGAGALGNNEPSDDEGAVLSAADQLAGGGKIVEVNITEQMKSAYIDYSMSVIVSRALPDVRDGLKPVHRRILYDMSNELGLYSDKPHRKSARIVGDVLGKFHPHGDSSVYDAMVRMAQDWSLRYPLIDGQGNFGSLDNDPPAAMRYTEARMRKIADEVMSDIDKDTIDFTLNFDDTLNEPTVLPTRVPLLLCNGASGIAVGMATNMAPHNLGEVVDACVAYIENPEIEVGGLLEYVKGPDFPTGAIIYGYEGVREALETGRGRVVMRAKTDIEHTHSGREMIVISEIPYQVNKAELIKKIADLINEKKIEGISYVNDESDRKGMRIPIILKHDAVASVVLNTLYKMTEMQKSFVVNNIALVDGRPQLLNLKDMVREFIRHRHNVVVRRTRFDLKKAEERAHVLKGLLKALDHIDEIISIIRASATPDIAKAAMTEKFGLTDAQTAAIIDMRLRALTGLERDKLQAEHDELERRIARFNEILASEAEQYGVVREELLEIKQKYGDPRRTEIIYSAEEFNPEDFYADEEMVITISRMGYIKRTPLTEYRTQARGGIGAKGSATRDEDFIEHLYVASMHNTMMLFTEKGRCYWLKVYNIPEGPRSAKGRAIQNLIQIEPDDKVRAYINVKRLYDEAYVNSNHIVMCTREGVIKKTLLEAYSRPRQNGVNAITIRESDQLIEAKLTSGMAEVMIASDAGKAIRFNESTVRPMGRTAAGVRGISLAPGEQVTGMICVEPDSGQDVLVLSEKGYGKRTDLDEYRITNRGGKGVKTINITEKTGRLISVQAVSDDDDLMIINRSGITIRTAVSGIRLAGRATQGVRIINLREGDEIASVVAVPRTEEAPEGTVEGASGGGEMPEVAE